MKKQGSPLKVKDYFTNPIHKFRQTTFLEVGFNQDHLNTFVKTFTNRYNSRYISFAAIKEFIATFTNNNPKLSESYEQFFINNFKVTEFEDILLEDFVQFFTRDQGRSVHTLDKKAKSRIFRELGELNQRNILIQSAELGVAMSQKEANNMIKMLNWHSKQEKKGVIEQETFLKALQIRQEERN